MKPFTKKFPETKEATENAMKRLEGRISS